MSDDKKQNQSVLNYSLDRIMSERFGRYSKYIIQGRALPDARDGLKPVQRRILFSMSELGLWSNKSFKKSARVVGDVIGKYHPHGDSSIYEAMVRMSQHWKMNMPLIEMHGNNGSVDDDPAAAMRYTEARLEKLSEPMLDGITKDTVVFAPNFDDSEREPTVLPGLVPNLLVNGAKGIAAGYATEMPPHNLGEVIDAIIAKVKSPNIRLDTLLNFIKGPDFPTGGIVQGKDGIYQAFERGSGRVVIRSKFEINASKTKPSITISELPYGVVKSKLVREIDEIRYNKKINGIKDVRDESDRNGISVFIELTPGVDAVTISKYLLQKTDMQRYYSYNNIAIKDLAPVQMGLIELIDAYLNHQKDVQTKAIVYDLKKDERRIEIVDGLIKVSEMADEVIDTIRKAEGSKSGVVKALIEKFAFTELQASAIAELRLYRLSRTDQSVYIEERENLRVRIEKARKLLDSPEDFDNYLIGLLKGIKQDFAVPRRTEVEDVMEKLEVNTDDLIKHENAWIGVSRQGYIKRFSNRAYEANVLKDYGLKVEDSIVYLHQNNTADKLLAFTDRGKYVFIPIHQIAEVKWKEVGKHINDFATLAPGEKIVDAISVNDFKLDAFLVLVTASGKAKRTHISQFDVSRYSRPLMAMKLSAGDALVGAKPSNGFKQAIIITASGKAVKYSETEIAVYGTKSSGNKAISIPATDKVTSFAIAGNQETIGLLSKRGGAKKIRVSKILPMSKKTQGKHLFRAIKANPHITIDSAVIKPTDTAMFRDDNIDIKYFKFNKLDITTPSEGFSSVGSSQTIDGKILVFNRIHAGSRLFEARKELSPEDKFSNAEKAIDQISIDDLLKGL